MRNRIRIALRILAAFTSLANFSFCFADQPLTIGPQLDAAPVTTNQEVVIDSLRDRLDQQEKQLAELRALINGPASEDTNSNQLNPENQFGLLPAKDSRGCDGEMIDRVQLAAELPAEVTCDSSANGIGFKTLDYFAGYEKGFVIKPFDQERHPFSLKINGWTQFRHHAFDRDVSTWTDQAGITRTVQNRNAFDIERGRLIFSGMAFDRRLTYFLQLDGDTDGLHTVDFFDYWWAWQLTDSFQLQFGKRKVTASRQWLISARNTRFVDRPMANDFFRPDRTVGVFGVGNIGDRIHYELMVGNGYSTANESNAQTDNRFAYSATGFIDPLGDFGIDLIDFESTDQLLLRLGHSFVFAPQATDSAGDPLGEADYLRLSDGTRLTQVGTLGPAARVTKYDVYFYGLDLAAKWDGWSANAEFFFRWIQDIEANLPTAVNNVFQDGFYVEGGRFLIPKRLDANLRYSQVNGEFGSGSEIAAGVNWFPLENSRFKLSFDVSSIDSSPLQNTSSDILVGDDGTLFRTQLQAEF